MRQFTDTLESNFIIFDPTALIHLMKLQIESTPTNYLHLNLITPDVSILDPLISL